MLWSNARSPQLIYCTAPVSLSEIILAQSLAGISDGELLDYTGIIVFVCTIVKTETEWEREREHCEQWYTVLTPPPPPVHSPLYYVSLTDYCQSLNMSLNSEKWQWICLCVASSCLRWTSSYTVSALLLQCLVTDCLLFITTSKSMLHCWTFNKISCLLSSVDWWFHFASCFNALTPTVAIWSQL